jgi:peptidoglycan/LPS O-acetylase OafA/YrhL
VRRFSGLDGIRGLAALYVVTYHVFLRAFPGSAAAHAPIWAAGFGYGRFAVVVFIVLSGFSLGLAPAHNGWRLDGTARFARRRAWRILPPYWAALVFSLLMTWFVLAQPGWPRPDGASVLVNGLLVQNVVAAPSPNRAFWSIAVEAQLYVLLPLMLLTIRRMHAFAMLGSIAAVVIIIGVLTPEAQLTLYTPDLAVLFATGVAAAGIVRASERVRSWPWPWLAMAAAAPVLAWIAWAGSTWTLSHLFWVDLALGPAIGCLLAAIATDRPKPFVRLLDTAPLRRLGSCSYSLYLTHIPIVIAVSYGIIADRLRPGGTMFLVLLAILVPLTVGFARLFAAVFEIPFVRHRGWPIHRARYHDESGRRAGVNLGFPSLTRVVSVDNSKDLEGKVLPESTIPSGS